ncbi:hypothetical protein [Pedobacter sp. L105]|uniref:hypothetical protein n=1 Tax=Pedobacter sp. L105 TaxID=1641871 RepID=UPI00131DD29D|nr:hypothetical protein [Pedobacter sp. L105]
MLFPDLKKVLIILYLLLLTCLTKAQIPIIGNTTNLKKIENTNRNVFLLFNKVSEIDEFTGEELSYNSSNRGDSLILAVNCNKNVSISVNKYCSLKKIKILIQHVDTLKIVGNFKTSLSIVKQHIGATSESLIHSIQIANSDVKEVNLPYSVVNRIYLNNSIIRYLNLNGSRVIDEFNLNKIRLDSSNFYCASLPGYMIFNYLDLTYSGIIDLTTLRDLKSRNPKGTFELERTIRFSNVDLDKFRLPYDRLNFHIDSLQDEARIRWIYEKLLRHLNAQGLSAKYEWYNQIYKEIIDSKEHSHFYNVASTFWWDKGYKKSQPIKISLWLFLLFTLINCYWMTELLSTYYPSSLKKYLGGLRDDGGIMLEEIVNERQRKIKNLHKLKHVKVAFIYTSFIFWGLRLDMQEFTVKKIRIYIYIIFQYLLGLLCAAYIVNFLVRR